MKTVAAAIREDLTRVKDVLDIFVRKGATQVDELVPQLEMLRKIADTLAVLGLGALRDRVQGEIETRRASSDRRVPPDTRRLLRWRRDDRGRGQPRRAAREVILPTAAPARCGRGAHDEEFRQVQDAVLARVHLNMARIKEGITQGHRRAGGAQGPFDQVPQLVRGITAGLLMLASSARSR